ncbi:MAG: CPBP family intramembrane glutamic endopeptidase [Saccharolobus sp.]
MNFMLPIILIFFPLYSWCGFAVMYGVLTLMKFQHPEIEHLFKTKGVHIHAILLVPLLLVAAITIPFNQLVMLAGLRLQLILWTATGFVVGVALFFIRVKLSNLVFSKKIGKIILRLNSSHVSFLSIVLPFAEDFLWRGVLITFFTELGFLKVMALALSAVSFGTIHYYFGKREILFKSFEGLFYGAIFLASESFIASGFAHMVYNHLVHGYNRSCNGG